MIHSFQTTRNTIPCTVPSRICNSTSRRCRMRASTIRHLSGHRGLNYGFNFPSQQTGATASCHGSTQRPVAEAYQARLLQQAYGAQASGHTEYGTPPYRTVMNDQPATHASTNTTTPATVDITPPQIKNEASPNPRTAARDQLWKLPETAKERSLSQANIRTVLFDPFQSDTTPAKQKQEEEPVKQDSTPGFIRHVSGNTLQPPSSFSHTPSKFFPTALAPQLLKSPSPTGSNATNNLRDSSPDQLPRKNSYLPTIPTITTTSASKGTPQTLERSFFPEELAFPPSLFSPSSASKTTKAEKHASALQTWWTSGATFARQEEILPVPPARPTHHLNLTPSSLLRPPPHPRHREPRLLHLRPALAAPRLLRAVEQAAGLVY